MNNNTWAFYVSYSWETEKQQPLVDKLEKDAQAFPKLKMVRDTNPDQCQPGDSIKQFLREVGQASRLVLVLSEPYFNSRYTLAEFAFALAHGGVATRISVVLVGDFWLDHLLAKRDVLQKKIDELGVDLKLEEHEEALEILADTIVSIPNARSDTNFSPMLQRILESYQRYPNPEIDDAEAAANLRATELAFLRHELDQFFEEAEDLQLLAESIREIAAQLDLPGSIGSLLCPLEPGDQQQRAYEQLFLRALGQTLEKAQRKKQISNDLLDYCSQVVGWIAISFVNDQWIKQHGVAISDRANPTPMTLGLSDNHGRLIELVVARSHKRPAGLKKSGQADFVSRTGIILNEPGSVSATLTFVFHELMIKFMPDRDYNEMTDDHWEELDTRIRAQRLDENLFIAFKSRESWQEVAKQLSDKLQCLPQFWLDGGDQSGKLFLLTGNKIIALIAESIRKIESYRKHAKSN